MSSIPLNVQSETSAPVHPHNVESIPPTAITPASEDHQHQALIQAMLAQTERYVNQPCQLPCKRLNPSSASLMYAAYCNYDIDPHAYHTVEECDRLQLRLEGDILLLATQCAPFTLDACERLRQKLATLLELSEHLLQSKTQMLQGLQDLTAELFKYFAIDQQSHGVSTALSEAFLDALSNAGVEVPAVATAVEAYAAVSRRWVAHEEAIADETQQVLALRLQVARLGLYQSAGQYLSNQARRIVADHLVDEEWVLEGDVHPGKVVLANCVKEPFLGRWPRAAQNVLASEGNAKTIKKQKAGQMGGANDK